MNALSIIKGVANVVTGATVGKTVDIFLQSNIPSELLSGKKERIAVTIGSAIIGALVSAKCSDYVENEIDVVAKSIEEIRNNIRIAQEDKDILISEGETEEE